MQAWNATLDGKIATKYRKFGTFGECFRGPQHLIPGTVDFAYFSGRVIVRRLFGLPFRVFHSHSISLCWTLHVQQKPFNFSSLIPTLCGRRSLDLSSFVTNFSRSLFHLSPTLTKSAEDLQVCGVFRIAVPYTAITGTLTSQLMWCLLCRFTPLTTLRQRFSSPHRSVSACCCGPL